MRAELRVPGGLDTLSQGLLAGVDGRPLDILVNNAATISYADIIGAATPGEYDRLFAVNVHAPSFITRRTLGIMRDSGRITAKPST